MEFPYQSTFLRSALVNDPYALGDVGPEDVLRIESEFPFLFDDSCHQPEDAFQAAVRPGAKRNLNAVKSPRANSALGKGLDPKICKSIGHKYTSSSTSNPKPRDTVAASIKNKPKLVAVDSRRHHPCRYCCESNVGGTVISAGADCMRRHLPSNVFCFSKDELKTMLEDAVSKTKTTQECTREHCATVQKQEPRQGLQNQPNQVPRLDANRKSHKLDCRKEDILTGKARKLTPELEPSQMLPSHFASGDDDGTYRSLFDKKWNGTASKPSKFAAPVPGFLRKQKSIQVSTDKKGIPKKSVTFSSQQKIRTSAIEPVRKEVNSRSSSAIASPRSDAGAAKEAEGLSKSTQDTKRPPPKGKDMLEALGSDDFSSSLTSSEISSTLLDTSIFVKGMEKFRLDGGETQNTYGDEEKASAVHSSFHQLKMATSLAKKYEQIGLLRKQSTQKSQVDTKHPKTLLHESSPRKAVTTSQDRKIVKSGQEQITFRKDSSSQTGDATLKQQTTTTVLEKLARELVYAEILKNISSIQAQEANTANAEEPVGSSNSSIHEIKVTPPSSVHNQGPFDMGMNTPQLTSSSNKNGDGSSIQEPPEKLVIYAETPVTPDLTASTLRSLQGPKSIPQASPQDINDNTDCSEISDFLASERERTPKSTNGGNVMENVFVNSEADVKTSIKTPSLSKTDSPVQSKSRSRPIEIDEKKASQITDVTFIPTPKNRSSSSTPSNSQCGIISSLNNSQDTEISKITLTKSKSSFTKSKFSQRQCHTNKASSSGAREPMSAAIADNSQSEFLISEGEFLGNGSIIENAVYRSPGEVSLSKCLSNELVDQSVRSSPGSVSDLGSDVGTSPAAVAKNRVHFEDASAGELL